MTKNLFRVEFVNPKSATENAVAKITESFRVTDAAIASNMPVHVLELDAAYACKRECGVYGRDLIVEWGDILFVKPGLLNKINLPWKKKSSLERKLKELSYDKKIVSHEVLSEGGLCVIGKEFVLVSDAYERDADIFEKVVKDAGLGLPLYFMPSMTSICGGHIDCDYQIIDAEKILYGGHNTFHGNSEDSKKAIKLLEKIAEEHDYELREYALNETEFGESSGLVDFDFKGIFCRMNGINFITDDREIFTSSISPEEEKYLLEKNIGAIVVPLGDTAPGAGVRCVYGEFTL